ncbi:carboxypeptidase regulatory-like domain-containing protein [Microcoleus sp. FACHB-1515]|uniref:carboxypeptidase regulatory-like domain-containing protein n=1 Tax=Cyanophyceae TaxID=3028117 RepID=UPI0016878D49|nr:carboxypeptidase-like regulatory domain-containing protein [Microcoleus sp. FACHB-1515]MBD2090846.1 carboxypeptidase regulatory-like domain-containing protein [Microcoleus sp. FACHB-1515]
MKSQFLGLTIAAGLTLVSQKAIAHGVEVQYQPRQGFEVSAAYDSGEPMANAQVIIFSPDNSSTPWQTVQTDAEGRFTFVPTRSGNWQVKIQQAGHGAALTIPVAAATTAPTASVTTAAADQPAHADAPILDQPASVPMTAATASPLQKGVMIGSVIWGCIGTALFFSRNSKRQQPQN